MDNTDSKHMFLDRGRELVPRWLCVGHRLTVVLVFCLMTFTVLTVITAVILSGYTLTTWLLLLWERVTSAQVTWQGPLPTFLC